MKKQTINNLKSETSGKSFLLLCTLLAALLISCSSSSSQQNIRSQTSQEEGIEATSETQVEASTEISSNGITDPTVEIEWFHYGSEQEYLRFVAKVSNPNSVGISGTELTWEALDENGAYVGSHTKVFNFIPAKSDWLYVGGAGSLNLSGPVAKIEIYLDSPGEAEYNKELLLFDVEEIVIDEYEYGDWRWTASARIKSPNKTISSDDLLENSIVYDRAGNIVCGDFNSFLSDSFPETVRPGTLVLLELSFWSDTCDPTDAYKIDLFVFEK